MDHNQSQARPTDKIVAERKSQVCISKNNDIKRTDFAGQNTCINQTVSGYSNNRKIQKRDLEVLKVEVETPKLMNLVLLLTLILDNYFRTVTRRLTSKVKMVASNAQATYSKISRKISEQTKTLLSEATKSYRENANYEYTVKRHKKREEPSSMASPIIAAYSSIDVATGNTLVDTKTDIEDDGIEEHYQLRNLFKVPEDITQCYKSGAGNSREINLTTKYKVSRDTVKIEINPHTLEFLIDSGADITLVKSRFIKQQTIDKQDITVLTGIGEGSIKTLGSLKTKITFNKALTIEHIVHVVSDDFPIMEDGIIGRDFFNRHKVDIRYSANELKIGEHNIRFSNRVKNQITLPARSETIIEIETPTRRELKIADYKFYDCNSLIIRN